MPTADPKWLSDRVKPERTAMVRVDLAPMQEFYSFGRVSGSLAAGGFIVSEADAGNLGIQLGDTVEIKVDQFWAKENNVPPNHKLPVTAIVEHLPFGPRFIVGSGYLPGLPDAQVYLSYEPGRAAEVKQAVLGLLRHPGNGFATYRDLREVLEYEQQAMNQRWAIVGAVVGVTFMISAFGLANSIVTGMHQRRQELATIRAIGSTPAQTSRQVMLEALLLGLAGSLVGLFAGAAFTGGVSLGLNESISKGYTPVVYLACLMAGPVLAAATGLLPSLRASRGAIAPILKSE